MPEAFDLRRMLEEIVEDEKISTSKRKKISQADIRRMLKERNRSTGGSSQTEPTTGPNVPHLGTASPDSETAKGSPRTTGAAFVASELVVADSMGPRVPEAQPAVFLSSSILGITDSRSPQSLIPPRIVRRVRAIPLRVDGRILYVGMEDPNATQVIQELELLTGMRVEPVALTPHQLRKALSSVSLSGGTTMALGSTADSNPDPTGIRKALEILRDSNGFDILLTAGSSPALKTHQGLEPTGLPPVSSDQCVQCAKALLTEWQWETLLQRHAIDVAVEIEAIGRFRVSAYRQRDSISLAIRKIPAITPSLRELQIPVSLDSIAQKPHGLAIFASPAAQGKTTTMNAILHSINASLERNIITFEDPVEVLHAPIRSTISQREIGRDVASFAEGLKQVGRQAPDVVGIGDIYDAKTFRLALDAAGAGHLVLCTLRAFNTTSALDNMIQQFPYHLQAHIRRQLTESLILVFSQRLVPTVDGQSLIVLHETLFNSPRIRDLLREGQLSLLRTQLHQGEEDFVPMDFCLKSLLHEGRIAVQDGAFLAENPAFVLGADVHSPY